VHSLAPSPCYIICMRSIDKDPEDDLASLAQEATNESTPDKALDEEGEPVEQRKVPPNRTKAPNTD
ncbi:MAG: hypothetical protein ACXW3Z_07140, partial [Limisphaerales bacterium]